jgi:chaperonin GroEL
VTSLGHEKRPNWGLDALSEQYVDLVQAGIIDPAKLTRSAPENAASVAGMILSTEALVTDLQERNASAAGPRWRVRQPGRRPNARVRT